MIRFILMLTFLSIGYNVQCDEKIIAPTKPVEPPPCTSYLCQSDTDDKLDDLLQDIAESCTCDNCKKCKVQMDLETFCEAYRNYDPKTYGLIQCIQNRVTNVCYKIFYTRFRNILNSGCNKYCLNNDCNVWQFFSDVCYGCNGCLDGCYISKGYQYSVFFAAADKAGVAAVATAAPA